MLKKQTYLKKKKTKRKLEKKRKYRHYKQQYKNKNRFALIRVRSKNSNIVHNESKAVWVEIGIRNKYLLIIILLT